MRLYLTVSFLVFAYIILYRESRSSPVGSIPSSAPRPIPPNVSPSATIIVSFDSEDDSIAPPASSARSRALEAALNRKTANLAEKQVAEVAHDHLTVTWAAEEVDDDVRISTKLELVGCFACISLFPRSVSDALFNVL